MPISLGDTINNPKKVSINLLSEEDAQTYEVGEKNDVIMVIYVAMAKREQKPVYINNDIFNAISEPAKSRCVSAASLIRETKRL